MKKKKLKLVIILLFITFGSFFLHPKKIIAAQQIGCGTYMYKASTGQFDSDCLCENHEYVGIEFSIVGGVEKWCCGWFDGNHCNASPPVPTPAVPIPPVDQELLDNLNPLKLFSTKADQLSTPGGIINEFLKYAFPIAGTILFLMLIFAGVKMLTGATNSKNMDEGKQIIGTAIAGFIILFASYWIIQLIEVIFGIKILGI